MTLTLSGFIKSRVMYFEKSLQVMASIFRHTFNHQVYSFTLVDFILGYGMLRLYENLYKSIAICTVHHLNAVNTGPVKRGQMTQIQNERFEQKVVPYRTKLFIGINAKCQKLLEVKATNI